MPENTTQTINTEEQLPFFARFLNEETTPETEENDGYDIPQTKKYPSDWEEY